MPNAMAICLFVFPCAMSRRTSARGQKAVAVRKVAAGVQGDSATAGVFAPIIDSEKRPIAAGGNEAVAYSIDDKKKQISQEVIGRVCDHGFIVRITTNAKAAEPAASQETAGKINEASLQVVFFTRCCYKDARR
jgi:hypothetical protein